MSVPFNMLAFHAESRLIKFDTEEPDLMYRFDWSNYILCSFSFRINRETPKGVWINFNGKEKFILSSARKKFAYATQDEAMVSFIARKRRQISILSNQLGDTKEALAFAELSKENN